MPHAILALDLGNSTCRLASVAAPDEGGAVEVLLRLPCSQDLVRELAGWFDAHPLPSGTCVALSSVASEAQTDEVADLLTRIAECVPCVQPPAGLDLCLEDSRGVGCDRLYAARAALDLSGMPTVVVDAGTALTVDAVRPCRNSDADHLRGEFLGGAIAPGPRLLAEALTRGGARLPGVDGRPGAPALGKDTPSALEAGIGVGFEGAALHLVQRVADEAGLDQPATVLTGGAAPFLRAALRAAAPGPWFEDPELVLRGLAASARDVQDGRS
ncbi:MAG: type III pantothenate kinase [bacterium]